MSIIIDRRIRNNQWSHRADDEPLGTGDVTVPASRWPEEREAVAGRAGRTGIRLQPGDALEDIVAYLGEIELIALEFDKFTEGRGYSHAYLLRERYGFGGELRAIGARRDHVMYMERCGVNAFEPAPGESAEQLLQGFDEITERYQPSFDRAPLIFRRRARGAPASEETPA